MRNFGIFVLLVVCLISVRSYGQRGNASYGNTSSTKTHNIVASDLSFLCTGKSSSTVGAYLRKFNWNYYNQEYLSDSVKRIVYCFELNRYERTATAWIYVHYLNDKSVAAKYCFVSDELWRSCRESVARSGFRSFDYYDTYGEYDYGFRNGSNVLLFMSEGDDEYCVTAYPKGSLWDPQNGTKREALEDGGYVEYRLNEGKIEGVAREFDDEGDLVRATVFKNGKRNGECKEYEEGRLSARYFHRDGLLNGTWQSYYWDGSLKSEGRYVDGNEQGVWTTYDMNGKPHYVSEYDDGEMIKHTVYCHDVAENYVIYHQEGTACMTVNKPGNIFDEDFAIINDVIGSVEGTVCYFNKPLDGDLVCYVDTAIMDNDTLSTFETFPLETDTSKLCLLIKGYFNSERSPIGAWRWYNPRTGKLDRESFFVAGELVHQKLFHPNGELFLETPMRNGAEHGIVRMYTDKGLLAQECPFEEGKINGVVRIHYMYDSVQQAFVPYEAFQEYLNDLPHGKIEVETYGPEGKVTGYYRLGLQTGEWVRDYDSIRVVENYYDDMLEGDARIETRDGRLLFLLTYHEDELLTRCDYRGAGEYKSVLYDYSEDEEDVITVTAVGLERTIKQEFDASDWFRYLDSDRFAELMSDCENVYEETVKEIDAMWSSKLLQMTGTCVVTEAGTDSVLCKGYVADGKKNGVWEFRFAMQGVKIMVDYSRGTHMLERYLTMEGGPFSGTFVCVDKENKVKEVRKIKKGFCVPEKTKYYDLATGKQIKDKTQMTDYQPTLLQYDRH